MVRAKMRCNHVGAAPYGNQTVVMLNAVYSTDPNAENKAFTDATPSAMVQLNIDASKPAAQAFEVGKEYYVDFIPAEPA